jgi:phosphatidate cytidylyltransferase
LLYCLPTTAVLLLLVTAGFKELARLAGAAGMDLLVASGMTATAAVAGYPYWHRFLPQFITQATAGAPPPTFALFLVLALLAAFMEQMIRYRTHEALLRIGTTMLAVLYLGVGGALLLWIRLQGSVYLVLFLVAVKFTDIGAYFTGIAVGRHKMIPWLSPGKSWEGLIGGLVLAAGASVLVAVTLGPTGLSLGEVALFAVAVGLAGQFGDLCESLLKRSAGIKDAGAVVPEFGGVLDIIDSPLLAAPVAMILLAIMV